MTDTFRALLLELVDTWDSFSYADAGDATDRMSKAVEEARAALAEPEPPKGCAVDPIPLSERKPGLEDRDHYGQCWWWGTSCTHRPAWVYASGWGTHWLPASTKCLPAEVEGASDAETVEPAPQPEPVGPTDEDLDGAFHEHCWTEDDLMGHDDFVKAARAVLARWGRLAVPEPVEPTDEELCKVLHQAICEFSPMHPDAVDLNGVQYELELEIRKARAVLARWGNQ